MAPAPTFVYPLRPHDDEDIRSAGHIQISPHGSWADLNYLNVKLDIFISKHWLENTIENFLISEIRAIRIARRNSRIDTRELKNRVREAMTLRSPLQPHDDAIQSVVHHLQNSRPNSWSEAAKKIARLSSRVDFFESKLQQLKEQAPNADKSESEEDIHKSNKSKSKILDIIQVLDLKNEVCDLNSEASDIILKYRDFLYDVCDLKTVVLHIAAKFPDLILR